MWCYLELRMLEKSELGLHLFLVSGTQPESRCDPEAALCWLMGRAGGMGLPTALRDSDHAATVKASGYQRSPALSSPRSPNGREDVLVPIL